MIRNKLGSATFLASANLSYSNLSDTNLENAMLQHADLSYSALNSANLKNSSLEGASLRETDLSSANLEGADLFDTDLSDSNLSNTRFRIHPEQPLNKLQFQDCWAWADKPPINLPPEFEIELRDRFSY